MKRYDVFYWVGNGYFVVDTDEDGLIVFGPGYGTYLPEWGNAQLMGAYFQYELSAATKHGAIQYIKSKIFESARKRSRKRRRRA